GAANRKDARGRVRVDPALQYYLSPASLSRHSEPGCAGLAVAPSGIAGRRFRGGLSWSVGLVPLDLQTGCLDDAAHAEGNGESRLQSELGHRRQHLFQSEQDLALGKVDAQAAMNAESERHVRRIAVEYDLVGILILFGIATGERNGQEHPVTRLQLYARHLDVIGTDALM